jgi:signal transduction histidine kinase/HAMP domain-containing protein
VASRRAKGRDRALSLRATFVAVVLAVALPLVLLLGYLAYEYVFAQEEQVRHRSRVQARILAGDVEKFLNTRLEAARAAAEGYVTGPRGETGAEAQVRRLRQSFPDFERIVVVDELGMTLAAVPAMAGGRRPVVGDQDWFKRAATATEPFVSGATRAAAEIHVGLYAPARTAEGLFRGVIAADLSLRWVQDLFGQATVEPHSVIQLVSDTGLVLARRPALYLLREAQAFGTYPELIRRGGAAKVALEDGDPRLVGAAAISPVGWSLLVGSRPTDVLTGARTRLASIGVLALALVGGGLTTAVVVARRQARGMDRLRSAMRRLEGGDIPASVPVTVGGEVGALTEGFNRMLNWLHGKLRDYEAVSRVDEVAGNAMSGDPSVDGILPGLLRRVVGGMGADAGLLALREGGALVLKTAVGVPGPVEEGGSLSRRQYELAWSVVADRAPIAVANVDQDPRAAEPHVEAAALRSVAGAPILVGEEAVGVIEVGYRLPHAFGEGELSRLDAMARRAGQAIAHVHTLDAVRRNTVGLETQLAERLEALQEATQAEAESRRQAQEARRRAEALEAEMQRRAAQPREVREVVIEKEVVRPAPHEESGARIRAALQRTVTEELRVPLSALMDLPRFLVEGLNSPLSQAEREQLEILRDRGEELLELIDNLVVLTGLEAGQVKIARAPFDLPGLIHRVVRTLQPRAAAKGNRIDADVKQHVAQIVGDARRVEQILSNLLINAITYTEVGEIRVTCYLRDSDVVLTVADDGAGFSPEEQSRIFEPFLQVGPRDGRMLPGTGLRLAVCRRLVELLGGRIRVESELNRGTWLTVSLPTQT